MLSVVIPAYNEEQSIGACLESLCAQTTKHPFEVIVVDNGSVDETARVAGRFAKRLNLRIVRELRKGRGAARARGCSLAQGEYIFSTDADSVVPPDWMEALVTYMENHPECVGVTGVARVEDCTRLQNTVINTGLPYILRLNYLFFGHSGLSGFNSCIRRDIYIAAGGFDPGTDAYEDLDLAIRMGKYGKLRLLTGMPVISSGRRFRDGILRGCWEYLVAYYKMFFARKRYVLLRDVQ